MPGRPLPSEDDMWARGFGSSDMVRRRTILRETLAKLDSAELRRFYSGLAATNLSRWREAATVTERRGEVRVLAGDWGEVTLQLTRKYGVCFAVLNMANAYVPGGGYVEGMVAQEENMYRRSDCHFHIGPEEYDETTGLYRLEATQLLSALKGKVYLDTKHPRVCLRGPEDRSRSDLGYAWLANESIFPFLELRASAQDLRNGSPFDHDDARKRIAAQLDTLRNASIRYAVLGAFGCGAFQNPSAVVARIYREEIDIRRDDFSLIAFAVFSAGYGPGNYAPFAAELDPS